MSWAEEVRVETPEQIDVGMELAGPGSRAAAQVLDWLFKGVVIGLLAVCGLLLTALFAPGGHDVGLFFIWGCLGLMAFIFFIGYDIYYEGYRQGQTPGKKYVGIRVVRDIGGPIDARAAAIRNLVGLADFLPGFYLGGGLLTMITQRGQRLGDLAAGTIVIRNQEARLPLEPLQELSISAAASANAEYTFTREQLDRCTAQDCHVLESYFQRRDTLQAPAREILMRNLLGIFMDKTGYQPTSPIDHEQKIEAFLGALLRDFKVYKSG